MRDYTKDLFKSMFGGVQSLISRKLGVTGASMYLCYEASEPMLMVAAGGVYVLGQALVEAFGKK